MSELIVMSQANQDGMFCMYRIELSLELLLNVYVEESL